MQSYQNCKRLFHLTQNKRIYPRKKAAPLLLGSAVHAYKEAYAQGLSKEQCERAYLNVFKEADTALLERDERQKFDVEMHRGLAMMEAYVQYWENNDAVQFSKTIAENTIVAPLIDNVQYKGIIDLLVQDMAGDWWVLDTKTASPVTINQAYFDRVQFDWQVLSYCWLATHKLGILPRGIIYEVLVKTQHRQTKSETLTQFQNRLRKLYIDEWEMRNLFIRHELLISEKRVNSWLKQARTLAQEIKNKYDEKKPVWYQNTGHCLQKWGPCSHMDICMTGKVNPMLFARSSK